MVATSLGLRPRGAAFEEPCGRPQARDRDLRLNAASPAPARAPTCSRWAASVPPQRSMRGSRSPPPHRDGRDWPSGRARTSSRQSDAAHRATALERSCSTPVTGESRCRCADSGRPGPRHPVAIAPRSPQQAAGPVLLRSRLGPGRHVPEGSRGDDRRRAAPMAATAATKWSASTNAIWATATSASRERAGQRLRDRERAAERVPRRIGGLSGDLGRERVRDLGPVHRGADAAEDRDPQRAAELAARLRHAGGGAGLLGRGAAHDELGRERDHRREPERDHDRGHGDEHRLPSPSTDEPEEHRGADRGDGHARRP